MTKTLPLPTWLLTVMAPPIRRTNSWLMARPRSRSGSRLLPGLGLLEMPEQLILVVQRNARARVLDFDPERVPSAALRGPRSRASRCRPRSVNLTALPRTLMKT